MSEPTVLLIQLGTARAPSPIRLQLAERARLERRARLLAWGGIG